ncbi:MAG TPA: DUF47 family protein [Candidatus Korarchaeota archaeon]|nr:MAG: hypothetical protein DRO05_06505 [Candidatus Korarchaeota archaeon]HDI73761.1 DUF47 family protein [Candidatus Korarchaeota archaeon]
MIEIGFLKKFGSKRWSPTFSMMLEHANLTINVIRSLRDAISLRARGEKESSLRKIRQIDAVEHEADQLRRRIMAKLTEGVLPPISRQDLVHLTRRLDYITDYAHEAARFLTYIDLAKMPDDLKEGIIKLAEETLRCAEATREAVKEIGSDFSKCLELCDEVERIEVVCDNLFQDLIGKLPCIRNLPAGLLLLVHDLILSLENVSDACENTIDVMRAVVIRASG